MKKDLFIGIDLGTSSVKMLLVDSEGNIVNEVSREYPLYFPSPGWSEQDPEDWINAVFDGIRELVSDTDAALVKGIGTGGQMHGLVILDENDMVIRPAILWNDGRTDEEVEYLNCDIGRDKLVEYTGNIAFAGFTAPKLLWLKKHEPENFSRIRKIMLPKDYINYRLTGVHSSDYSDASGTLLLDVKNKCWSEKMLEICSISPELLPVLYESFEAVGSLLPNAAEQMSLGTDVIVCAGAGDNAAAAVGTGISGCGSCNISLGTSGTVFITGDRFEYDPSGAIHSFAHADGKYHMMACILSAASCNKWFMEEILHSDDYTSEQVLIGDDRLGNNNVYFLPYLMGERSPINNTKARGAFIGMSLNTTRSDMLQAVLEGVAFAVKDNLEVIKRIGIDVRRSMICGGGAKSSLWKKIISNVLNIELSVPVSEQGPGMGGAMLAMVAAGVYKDVEEVCKTMAKVSDVVKPDLEIASRYAEKYERFRKIYPGLKEVYDKLY